jgi:hypothetical protein
VALTDAPRVLGGVYAVCRNGYDHVVDCFRWTAVRRLAGPITQDKHIPFAAVATWSVATRGVKAPVLVRTGVRPSWLLAKVVESARSAGSSPSECRPRSQLRSCPGG